MNQSIDVKDLRQKGVKLVVQLVESSAQGRCYNVSHWVVYSDGYINHDHLRVLIPYGQEFSITERGSDGGFHTAKIRTATDSSD